MDAARIRILIEADASSVAAGLAGARTALNAFSNDATRATGRITSAFDRIGAAGRTIGIAGVALAGITAAFAATIRPAIQFESAFAGVKKTVDGTPAQLAGIRDGLLGLAGTLPTTTDELAGIAEAAGQLGIAAPDILQFTEIIAMLGETTNLSFDDAATSLARFLNVTNGSVDDLPRLADIIVDLGNNSATTEGEILTLAQRMAAAFTLAGEGQDEILGLAAGMSSLGLPAEAGATAMIRLAKAIDDATIDGGDALERFSAVAGVTAAEFTRIEEASPTEAILLFSEGLVRLQDAGISTTPILEELGLNSVRVRLALDAVGGGSEVVRAALERVGEQAENGGALLTEYGAKAETTASRIELLQNRLSTLAINIGTPALDTFAAGADIAGDAIERLADILSPLGSAIAGSFSEGSSAASEFFDILGSPALQGSVLVLEALVDTVASVVGAFNALGPAGLIIAALATDIALVGPVSRLAATALTGMGVSTATLGSTATGTAVAMRTLSVSINPVIAAAALLGAAFVLSNKQLREIRDAASAAGDALRNDLSTAFEANDIAGFETAVASARAELEQLDGSLTGTDKFLIGLNDVTGGMSGLTNETTETSLRIRELQAALDEENVARYENEIARLADRFGTSEEKIKLAVEATGQFGNVLDGSLASVIATNDAVGDYLNQLEEIGPVTDEVAIAILDGSASLEQYADALGITSDRFGFLFSQLEGFDEEDLFDPETNLAALAAVENLLAAYEELGASIGITGEEYAAQLESLSALIGAHDELSSAITEASNAMRLLNDAQAAATAAQEAYNDAVEEAKQSGLDEDFRAAALAGGDLIFSLAGLGTEFTELSAKQQTMIGDLVALGVAQGRSREEVIGLIAALAGIPPAVLSDIIVKADEANRTVDDFTQRSEDLAGREYLIQLGVDPSLIDESFDNINGTLDEFENETRTAKLDADVGDALDKVNSLLLPAQIYNDTGWNGSFDADTGDAVAKVEGLLLPAGIYNDTGYTGKFDAETDVAEGNIGRIQQAATAYDAGTYNPDVEATDAGASTIIEQLTALATGYAGGNYDAQAEATDAGASTVINQLTALATGYAGNYTATLTAIDNASSVIGRAVGALSGFVSKTIDITTRNVVENITRSVTQSAAGSVTPTVTSGGGGSSGSVAFANGGFFILANGGIPDVPPIDENGVPAGAVIERPGPAKIYSAATAGRYFAEAATGGEAFIPLGREKRQQAMNVFEQVGRMFGVFADGGIAGVGRGTHQFTGGTVIAPQISIDVTAAQGMSEQDLADKIQAGTEQAIVRVARQMANTRR